MPATDLPLDSFPTVWNRAVKIGTRILWVAGLAVCSMVILEAVHLYELLAGIHPWVALTATLLVALPVLGWIGFKAARFMKNPVVMAPPDLPPVEDGWNEKQQRKFRRFAVRYLERQAANPRLPEASRTLADEALDRFRKRPPFEDSADPVHAARRLSEEVGAAIDRIVAPLDAEAKRLIRRAAAEVAVATAVSPSVLMDFMITFGRNVNLMSRLADLYYGRPGLLGTFRIGRDVLGTAAMAGALEVVSDHVTSALSEMSGAWIARFLGPMGQGLVNGVVTLRIGAAARMRCRAVGISRTRWQPWRIRDYKRAARSIAKMVKDMVGPVAGAAAPAPEERPGGRTGFFRSMFRWIPGGDREPAAPTEEEKDLDRAFDPVLDGDLLEDG